MNREQAFFELSRIPEGLEVIRDKLERNICPLKLPQDPEFYSGLDPDIIELLAKAMSNHYRTSELVWLMLDKTELIPALLRPTIKYDQTILLSLGPLACLACIGDDAVAMKTLIDQGYRVRVEDLGLRIRQGSEILAVMVEHLNMDGVVLNESDQRILSCLLKHPDVDLTVKDRIRTLMNAAAPT